MRLKDAGSAGVNGDWNPSGGHAQIYSGHESFACRYGWLPKLYEAVQQDEGLFSSDERSILALGLGKNMVKALRFWGQTFGLLHVERGSARNTEFARRLLDGESGIDPYLEKSWIPLETTLDCNGARRAGGLGRDVSRVARHADHAESID